MLHHCCYYFKFCYVCQKNSASARPDALFACAALEEWLEANDRNVVVLHCLAGKVSLLAGKALSCNTLAGLLTVVGIGFFFFSGSNWTCHCVSIVLYGTVFIDEICIASFCRAPLKDFKGRAPVVATSLRFV